MRRRLLDLLASPCCRNVMEADCEWSGDEAAIGHLICKFCRQRYPVIDGVPRLLPPVELAPGVAQTRESFAWEWLRHPGPRPDEDRAIFLEETQIPAADWRGKLALDAGCGMGRYSLAAAGLGAEVVAFDLSEAALRLKAAAKESDKLHVVMGDINHPPFRRGIFDVVFSLGVLHHAADTQTAFRRVAELVRDRGLLTFWVYGKAGRLDDFRTNPLREGRRWVARHRALAWLVVALRHALSDVLRLFTVRLPVRLNYALCFPVAVLGAVPLVKYLTPSVHPDFRVRLIEDFDWLSPVYQHHHSKEELRLWLQEAGFTVLKVLPHGLVPKPGMLARKTDHVRN
ncbi:MAG: methyltransferase domain-containing protein [Elusimicrobia bacterium]|nr:methyltransferase domain-containing protein [Elusimicrobiota bacterium]